MEKGSFSEAVSSPDFGSAFGILFSFQDFVSGTWFPSLLYRSGFSRLHPFSKKKSDELCLRISRPAIIHFFRVSDNASSSGQTTYGIRI
jgi:hypothetical protein